MAKPSNLCAWKRCRQPHEPDRVLCAKHGATPAGRLLERAAVKLRAWIRARMKKAWLDHWSQQVCAPGPSEASPRDRSVLWAGKKHGAVTVYEGKL